MVTKTATIKIEGDSWVDISNKFAPEVVKLHKEEKKLGGSWALVSEERKRVWLGTKCSEGKMEDYGFEYRIEAHYEWKE